MRGIGKRAVTKAVARSVSRPAGGDIDEIGAVPVASAQQQRPRAQRTVRVRPWTPVQALERENEDDDRHGPTPHAGW